PKVPAWLLALIWEVSSRTPYGTPVVTEPSLLRFYCMPRLEELLAVAGEPSGAILHLLYGPEAYAYLTDRFLQRLDGVGDYLAAHAGLVAATPPPPHAARRERLKRHLRRPETDTTGTLFSIA